MTTALVLALLTSLVTSSGDPPPPSKTPPAAKLPGRLTVEFSTDAKTQLFFLTSTLTRNGSGELVPEVEFQGFGGKVTTTKQGAQPQVYQRTTAIQLEVRLSPSLTPTNAARVEAQLDRCVALASDAPKRKFVAVIDLGPEAYAKLRAQVIGAGPEQLRLSVDATGITGFSCSN